MNKKYLSALLFGALTLASTGTFTSCKDYDDDIENLQGQIGTQGTDLKGQIEKANQAISSLQTAQEGLKSEIKAAAASASAAQTAADAAQTAADAAQAAADAAQATGDQAKIDAAAAAQAAAAADAKAAQATADAAIALQAAKDAEKAAIDEAIKQIGAAKAELQEKIDALANAHKEDVAKINGDILAINTQLAELLGKVSVIEENVAKNGESIVALQKTTADNAKKIAANAKEIEKVVADLGTVKEELQNQITTLNGKVSTLEDKVAKLEEDVDALTKAIAKTNDDLAKAVASLNTRIDGLDAKIADEAKKLGELKGQFEQHVLAFEEYKVLMETTLKNYVTVDTFNKLKAQVEEEAKKLEALKEQVAKDIAAAESRLNVLVSETKKDLETKIDANKKDIEKLDLALQQDKQDLADAKIACENARKELKKALEDYADAKDASLKTELEGKISQLEAKLTKLIDDKLTPVLQRVSTNETKIQALQEKDTALEKLIQGVQEDLTNAKKDLKDQITEAVNAGNTKIANLNKTLTEKIENGLSDVYLKMGRRVSSITLIPETHINGIPSMEFMTLQYTPQSALYGNKAHNHDSSTDASNHSPRPWLDHKDITNAKVVKISTNKNKVSYKVSPNKGVAKEDIQKPIFECIESTNTVRSNSPIVKEENNPLIVSDYTIENGVLTVSYGRNPKFTDLIQTDGDAHRNGTEKFWMASVKAPIADKYLTEAEKANGGASVNSEYVRVEEHVYLPYLANSKTDFTKPIVGDFADEMQNNNFVHYHDSACVYNSANNVYVDVVSEYNKPVDLLKLVTVCGTTEAANGSHANHVQIANYADYGLKFDFALAQGKYLQGTRQTDEQAFGKIIVKDGRPYLRSEVYDVDLADGQYSKTSIGREPIVRVRLFDTNNNNALIAQRYIKFHWEENVCKPQTIPGITFDSQYVSCHDMFQQLFTKDMNEKIYHQVKFENGQSISKEDFHSIYSEIEVVELKKDGVVIPLNTLNIQTDKNGWYEGTKKQVVDGEEAILNPDSINGDVVFTFLEDDDPNTYGNLSYNLLWAMDEQLVGKIKDGKSSKFEITVKYVDKTGTGSHGDITQTFTQEIQLPVQEFHYQGTYWKANEVGKVFNVNPLVYDSKTDGTCDSTHAHWNSLNVSYGQWANKPGLKDLSHIEADLVNGYIYKSTKQKPTSLAQFIKYIRGCAQVKFVFDEEKFSAYKHLNGFKVSPDGTQLWFNAVGTPTNNTYMQPADYAAAILNNLGATATTNADSKTTYPWDWNEVLNGNDNDACESVIRLYETNNKLGTPAAIKLIGKQVPVKLLVKYNDYNTVAVQKFDVRFIEPLTIDGVVAGNFVDAMIDGSYLNVASGLNFTDWNNYKVAAAPIVGTPQKPVPEKSQYAHQLYDYYAVNNIQFLTDTDKVTTSLSYDDATNTYIHKEGVTDGVLPTDRSLESVVWDETKAKSTAVKVTSNPTHLVYKNNHGTPVNVDYNMFIDVTVNYKWGVLSKRALKIQVKKSEGIQNQD